MDLKLMQRFLPYALFAFITITSLLWSRRWRRSRGNPERFINSEEGEAEASSPPSSSPSFVREDIGFKYDVFLSFRGPDTRKGFTGHLYEALKGKGIDTFIDSEELEKGQKVEELFECIERSKIFVPIFSNGYADSKWCLKEITRMVECKRLIVPIFIDVEPKDVRNQTGPFAPAFERHHRSKKIDKEEVSRWSAALTEAGKVLGYTLAGTEGNQSMLVDNIVRRIVIEVNKTPLSVAEHPVGLNSRIADLMKMMEIEAHIEAKMVGIHGLGGVGKTTVAKEIYNQISSHFEACCFLFNVRSEATNQSDRLISLQEQLLREAFKDKNTDISSKDEGISKIKQRIRSKKVLLVLDDVDSESQLEALAGGVDWFGSGSRIIITTRDKGMLKAAGVHQYNMYKLEELDSSHSLELFSWHAFRKEVPDLKFAELSKEVASVAAGLPLALKIFGSLFRDLETVELWVSKLEELKKYQDKGLHETLKISYDALDEKAQEVFLDIACFFIGQERENATYMWEGCGFFPDLKINVLICKCLVSVNDDTGQFEMHDHIRDMGRKIVQDRKYICRLWKDDETLDILQTKKGKKKIEAIQLNSGTYEKPMHVEAESFVAMSELRMLRLGSYVHLEGEFKHFPKKLRWLEWHPQDLDSLPDGLHLENIVVLDISFSWITQLWNPQGMESTKVFGKMKVLMLTNCSNLTICPDLTSMSLLQKLNFDGCKKMSELHPSIGHLKSLTHLSLGQCSSLERVPQEIWQLTSLQELGLKCCYLITTLPSQMEDSKSLKLGKLKVLNFQGCSNLTICPDFTRLPHLQKLNFCYCSKMSELHPSIGLLKSLTHLSLGHCRLLKRVPQEIWQLTSLEELDLNDCLQITTLPSQTEGLKSFKKVLLGKLKVLDFSYCSNLTICPDFTSMPHLEKLNFAGCKKMSELHPSVGLLKSLIYLNLGLSLKELAPEIWQLTSLEELDLSGCTELTTLPSQLGNSKSLTSLCLWQCVSLMELPEAVFHLTSLKNLILYHCEQLEIIPDLSRLKGLQTLSLRYCKRLVNVLGIQDLDKLAGLEFHHCDKLIKCPLFSSNMTRLQTLDFEDCAKMTELDPSIGQLKNLTALILTDCKSLKELPQEVSQLTSLTWLDLTGCYQISALPESMRHLKQLKGLCLLRCSSLREIPECICSFLNLEELDASHCQRIAFLPNWIEKLKSLVALDLSWTAIEELPHSIVSLENLKVLSVSHCYRLKFLPWFPPSLTTLKARGCGKLEDVPNIKQIKLLRGFHLGGCRSLHDSFLERLQEANFQNLGDFAISGKRLVNGGSSSPQSLSFLLPKHFERGILYLHIDKSSLDNICSELDECNGSELVYKSFPSHEAKDSQPGRVVLIEITTGDAKFQFSALMKIKSHETSEMGESRKLPTATFGRDSELMKMAKDGEFKGNGDARRRTMMTMRVSIDGCVPLHGDIFTYTKNWVDWLLPDPIEAVDHFVIVEFGWQS